MTLIPAVACLATVLEFYQVCPENPIERENSLYWRSSCSKSGNTLYWYDAAPEFLEIVQDSLLPGMSVVCHRQNELVVIWDVNRLAEVSK